MSTSTVATQSALATDTAAYPALLAAALKDIDRIRADAALRLEDCRWIESVRARYSDLITELMMHTSGHVWITVYCAPDRIEDMAPFLRELREHTGKKIEPRQSPEHSAMIYDCDGWYVMAHLRRSCTFRKVGVRTVEQPVYEIQCGDAPTEIAQAAV